MVFGTAAEAGDATDVAPTNIPAHSAPITLFLRIDPFLRFGIVVPFRWALSLRWWGSIRRLGAVMR
jgi:hypothetical protein